MYNYYDAMKNDVIEYLSDNEYYYNGYTRDELEDQLNDDLWTVDSVTGNGSGSYTFSREDAKKYVQDDGVNYLRDALEDFCVPAEDIVEHFLDEDYEYFDVTIRCYLLPQVVHDVMDEFENDGYWDEEDEEDQDA